MKYLIETTIRLELNVNKAELKRELEVFQDAPVGMFINSPDQIKVMRLK